MVPAESMLNLESKPLFLTKSVKTPSAAGLLQMLPKQTKSTEKGLVPASASVSGVAEEAMDAFIRDPNEKEEVGLQETREGIEFWRSGYWVGGRRTGIWGFRERALGWKKWPRCKCKGDDRLLCSALIPPESFEWSVHSWRNCGNWIGFHYSNFEVEMEQLSHGPR